MDQTEGQAGSHRKGWAKCGLGDVLEVVKQVDGMRFCMEKPEEVVGVEEEQEPAEVVSDVEDEISTAKKKVIGSSQANYGAVGWASWCKHARAGTARRRTKCSITAAPPSPAERGQRLHHSQYGRGIQGTGIFRAGHVHSSGCDRLGLADCRRHRHHEHHAGSGDRAHQGNGSDRPWAPRPETS